VELGNATSSERVTVGLVSVYVDWRRGTVSYDGLWINACYAGEGVSTIANDAWYA
jgi:hypothetical protein